ncbi:hypothetical protein [Sinimarinibacterium sp. NLF-5-8]|uniref:hypothetical protein n=1 Tax=Sinimarinibacterium sp. NLF-5-8 TaxID=2698684 RepID=UPI00137BAA6D|nr:hypothetical protein [Sinimarinibacterium sp. NLF-5-8]QHS10493.1 hypothetical protein GT972_10380 [Sinimarinibacterium sp. NLF-5-8]
MPVLTPIYMPSVRAATATPIATPTATPSVESARACFNPYLYAIGARSNRVTRAMDAEGQAWRVTSTTHISKNTSPNTSWIKYLGELEAQTEESRVPEDTPDAVPETQTHKVYFSVDAVAEQIATLTELYSDVPPFYIDTPHGGGDDEFSTAVYFSYRDPGQFFRYDLAPGDSYEQNYTVLWEPEVIPLPGFNRYTIASTTRFAGAESVTVPAGTFVACRFDEQWEETNIHTKTTLTFNRTLWLAKTSGILLRLERGNAFEELISAEIDGVAVTPSTIP